MKITCVSMDIICEDKAIIQPLAKDWYGHKVAAIDMLRLDLIHPVISGNKWYKLKHNLHLAVANGARQILTFGGAYSNHLVAAAAASRAAGIASIGIVRGMYASEQLTPTLQECIDMGMRLVYVPIADYKKKNDTVYLQGLQDIYGASYIIPEGGANDAGREGAADIALLIPHTYSHVCICVGTGTSLVGIRNALPADVSVRGFGPFKDGAYLKDEIAAHLDTGKNTNWDMFTNWHFGGFGKWDKALLDFMNDFYQVNNIPLDIIYTAKMMYGVKDMIVNGEFPLDSRILCIHTGGLQGNRSVQQHLVYQ